MTKIRIYIFLVIHFVLLAHAHISFAQESQILSVTPPLFQLSVLPGDVWQSSVKVVNGNSYPLTVYAEVVNFEASGETGQGKFIPIIHDSDTQEKATLAEWIHIPEGPYVISPEQTADISFFVDVPKNASPGGHYAAIIISTQPSKNEDHQIAVEASQAVTSLFFVRIEGDVIEDGIIREFRTQDSLLERPNTEFSLRFENKGNVHLQPRGDIVITNMWGTQRGKIPVNYQTHFGNVLPKSIRDFKFTWNSDFSIADIGRYKAVATLSYGSNDSKNVTSVTYFWVIPIKTTLIVLTILIAFILSIVWMVKAYVRKMLSLAGVSVTDPASIHHARQPIITEKNKSIKYRTISAPIKNGVLDLRKQLELMDETANIFLTIWRFIVIYKKFFIALCILIIIFITSVLYIGKATEKHDRYNVTIEQN